MNGSEDLKFRNLAKLIVPYDTRRKLRYHQNRLLALCYSIHDFCFRSNEELQPIPPPLLRYRVHGHMGLIPYTRVGHQCAYDIQKIMAAAGRPVSSMRRVLDFGCGCGRTLKLLVKNNPATNFSGTDIDSQSIDWCRENFQNIEFSVNHAVPPLPYSDNKFDFIYAISVFSHLSEESHIRWLGELSRVAEPRGYLLATFHGEKSQSVLSEQERNCVAKNGFFFKEEGKGKYKLDGLPDTYQSAYISKDYIKKYWSKYFEIENIINTGMNNHQNVVLLRKS